jgi:hypothetical protein
MSNGIYLSSQARALADNTRRTRSRGTRPPATLSDGELADWIDHLARGFGSDKLIELRAQAERLAPVTGTEDTIGRMSELIGAAVGTKKVNTPSTRLRSRQEGVPYDHARLDIFERLADHLRSVAPSPVFEPSSSRGHLLPFYEAYFSNFIEGTELDLDDAEEVVFQGRVLEGQPEDSHDVAATYGLVADPEDRGRTPSSAEEFLELLTSRHGILLAARPEKHPRRFKSVGNRAGATTFVHPDDVEGTLRMGWNTIDALDDPFHRAVMVAFVVAEVHPFDDGNGRIARIMMNAELTAGGQCRIVVPSVYRLDYLSALGALSHNARPSAIVSVLAFAQRWTSQIDWSDRQRADADLEATNAFVDSGIAILNGTKLLLPAAVPSNERAMRVPEVTQPRGTDAQTHLR